MPVNPTISLFTLLSVIVTTVIHDDVVMNLLLQRFPVRAARAVISASPGISVLTTTSFATEMTTALTPLEMTLMMKM